jgi:hypothetical protein
MKLLLMFKQHEQKADKLEKKAVHHAQEGHVVRAKVNKVNDTNEAVYKQTLT